MYVCAAAAIFHVKCTLKAKREMAKRVWNRKEIKFSEWERERESDTKGKGEQSTWDAS